MAAADGTARAAAVAPPPFVHDQGVPWHYGEPLREQRWLADGTGIVDLGNRGVVTVRGSDRRTWLHALTTQHLCALQPGESALALILDPQGHVEFELHLWDDGETTWLITEPDDAASLVGYLESMRFLLDVEVTDRTGEYAALWCGPAGLPGQGPGADAGQGGWSAPEPFFARGLVGRQVVVPRSAIPGVLDAGRPCGTWALEALRVASLMPREGCETDARTIPNEVGWLGSAVHLDKGCYRGQETVAKVHNLGRPPRRLALLHCPGTSEVPPRHGDLVEVDGRAVGWVGSGVQHYELGPIATAVLKRSVPLDAVVTVIGSDGERADCAQDPELHA